MSQGTPKEKPWNPNIQALRGLSILLVLIAHLFDKPGQFGTLGVGIFFCISGYLITNILISEYDSTKRISISHFYVRRARRLLPLAYLMIALVVLIAGLAHLWPSTFAAINTPRSFGGFKQYLLSALFSTFYVGNLFGYAHLGYNDLAFALGHFWTLAVEEQFYLVWPLLLWLVLKKWRSYLSAVCILGIFTTPAIHFILSLGNKSSWTLPTSYLDLFLFGALFTIHREKIRVIKFPILVMLVGVVAVALLVRFDIKIEDFSSQGYVLFTIAELLLFIGLFNWKYFGGIRWLRKMGDWSYALYCIHWPIICLLHDIHMNLGLKRVVAITLSIFLAALSTKYYETLFWRPRFREAERSNK